jgi:hypothetical protein
VHTKSFLGAHSVVNSKYHPDLSLKLNFPSFKIQNVSLWSCPVCWSTWTEGLTPQTHLIRIQYTGYFKKFMERKKSLKLHFICALHYTFHFTVHFSPKQDTLNVNKPIPHFCSFQCLVCWHNVVWNELKTWNLWILARFL